MEFPVIVLFLLIVTVQTESAYQVSDFAIERNCTEVYSITTPKYVPYEETYRTRNWLGFTKWKTRTNYRIENHVSYQRRSVCCNGYTSYSISSCIPLCSKNCGSNGVCSEPERCKCSPGYSMDNSDNECRPVCSEECINAKCLAPQTCVCNSGYKSRSNDTSCEPVCRNCSSREFCFEPNICRCKPGYHRSEIDRVAWSKEDMPCEPICDMTCINADCVEPNVCKCHDGYEDLDGDVYSCEPKCSNGCVNGICTEPETCLCFPGHQLSHPGSNVCEPICTDDCINADCVAPDLCSCRDGYVPTAGEYAHVCNPYCNSSCTNGRCSEPDKCSCNPGYISWDGNQTCEPVCTKHCVMGSCTAPDTCTCYEGYRMSERNNFICEPVCSQGCINGQCTAPNECSCDDGYEMKNATSSKCIVICECQNGFCNDDSSTCESCSEGYELTLGANSTTCQPHCEGNCSSHGQCVEPQRCDCDENYVANNDTLGNPVCLHACGGDCKHGTCDPITEVCSCFYGWSGKFCEDAVLCVIRLYNDSKISSRPLEWDGYEDSGDWVAKEEPWTGPICLEKCLSAVDNTTKCLNQTDGSQERDWLICFMRLESSCNTVSVIMANLYKYDIGITTIVVGSSIVLLALATIVSACLVFRRKRRRGNTIVMKSKEQERPEAEADRLIENENDGISL